MRIRNKRRGRKPVVVRMDEFSVMSERLSTDTDYQHRFPVRELSELLKECRTLKLTISCGD